MAMQNLAGDALSSDSSSWLLHLLSETVSTSLFTLFIDFLLAIDGVRTDRQ